MPKMIVSLDGVVIKEVQLSKDRTSLGRRPYNDIVIDNLAVSGEHAVLQMSGSDIYVEDLNSTNGTYVNGKTVKKQLLKNGDFVEIGKYSIQYVSEAGTAEPEPARAAAAAPGGVAAGASIKVMSGTAAGREVPLVKFVSTIGKPGIAVAAITNRAHTFVIAHVEGESKAMLNGVPVGIEPLTLKNGDMFELAGTKMQFIQA